MRPAEEKYISLLTDFGFKRKEAQQDAAHRLPERPLRRRAGG